MGQLLQMGIGEWGELRETTEINSTAAINRFAAVCGAKWRQDPNHLGLNEEDLGDKTCFQVCSRGIKGVEGMVCVCVCLQRRKKIITETRSSGEIRHFEERRNSSPVVQNCEQVNTSEENKIEQLKKIKGES